MSLNFFLLMEKVLRLSRLLSGVGASAADLATIIAYIQPQLMLLTVPMALLLSVLLTYGRLNADNELIALKAAGMSFLDISRPVFVLGTVCFLLGILVSFVVSPAASLRLRAVLTEIITERAPLAVEAGIFNTAFRDLVILVREKPAPDHLRGVFIYDSRNRKEPKSLTAREGRISAEPGGAITLSLKDGHIHIGRPDGSTEVFFGRYRLFLNLNVEGPSRKNSELTPAELLKDAGNRPYAEQVPFLLEFHRRLSMPGLCLFLMLLGPPLALIAGKAGRLGGLTVGLAVFTAFYVMLVYGENTVRSGLLPHYAGAWLPVIVLGLMSIAAFRQASAR